MPSLLQLSRNKRPIRKTPLSYLEHGCVAWVEEHPTQGHFVRADQRERPGHADHYCTAPKPH